MSVCAVCYFIGPSVAMHHLKNVSLSFFKLVFLL